MVIEKIHRNNDLSSKDLYEFKGVIKRLKGVNNTTEAKNKIENLDEMLDNYITKLNEKFCEEKKDLIKFVKDIESEIFNINIDVGRDYYTLLFNITKIKKMVAKKKYKTEKRDNIYLKNISRNTSIDKDIDYSLINKFVDSDDKVFPIILRYEYVENKELLIDGNHRVRKAPVIGKSDVHLVTMNECEEYMPKICVLITKLICLINTMILYMNGVIEKDKLDQVIKNTNKLFMI